MSATPAPTLLRRAWRLLRWLLLLSAALLVALAVFHQSLLLWLLNHAVPHLAAQQGVKLQWQVSGSLWSDLKLIALSAELPAKQQLQASQLSAEYDSSALWRGDYLRAVKQLTVQQLHAELDLTQPTPPVAAKQSTMDWSQLSSQLQALQLPELRLENVSLTLHLPTGKLMLKDIDLLLPRDRAGTLHIGLVEREPALPAELRDITAELQWLGQELRITSLKLPGLAELPVLMQS
jgi:hypothetical protein